MMIQDEKGNFRKLQRVKSHKLYIPKKTNKTTMKKEKSLVY